MREAEREGEEVREAEREGEEGIGKVGNHLHALNARPSTPHLQPCTTPSSETSTAYGWRLPGPM